jgi:hypothetical protein
LQHQMQQRICPPSLGAVLGPPNRRYRISQHVSGRRAPARPTNPPNAGKQWLLIKELAKRAVAGRLGSWRGALLLLCELGKSDAQPSKPKQRPASRIRKRSLLGSLMPGMWAGWRNDWMARDAGEVVEVVETGLSAKKAARRERVFSLFTHAVTRQSNQRPAMKHYVRRPSRPSCMIHRLRVLKSSMFLPYYKSACCACCSQNPPITVSHSSCQKRIQPQSLQLLIYQIHAKEETRGLPFLVLKP